MFLQWPYQFYYQFFSRVLFFLFPWFTDFGWKSTESHGYRGKMLLFSRYPSCEFFTNPWRFATIARQERIPINFCHIFSNIGTPNKSGRIAFWFCKMIDIFWEIFVKIHIADTIRHFWSILISLSSSEMPFY